MSAKNSTNNTFLPGDELVLTSDGYEYVRSLVGKEVYFKVDGKIHKSPNGFFYTGTKKDTIKIEVYNCQLSLADNHEIMTDSGWVNAIDLKIRTLLKTNLGFFPVVMMRRGENVEVYGVEVPDIKAFYAQGIYVRDSS